MTSTQSTQLLDRLQHSVIYLHFRDMHFPMHCQDVRKVYNRVDVLVTPKDGAGSSWVDVHSLSTEFNVEDSLR